MTMVDDCKILITTSGVGSRLGEFTKHTNKSLVRIGKKPSLSYIIEGYPKDIPIVITLGYFGDLVKDFLELAYPERTFEYVRIDPYQGPGSSLIYSLLQAQINLQCPFIFHACDTIVFENIPKPEFNWVGSFTKKDGAVNFRTINRSGDTFIKFNEKGESNFDDIYIGLAGIKDYDSFWNHAAQIYENNKDNEQLSDCHIFNKITQPIMCHNFSSWIDMGNMESLHKSRKIISDKFDLLDKIDESIFIFDDFVIKFFADTTAIKNRLLRAEQLKGFCPEILDSRKNYYKYAYIKGEILSKNHKLSVFRDFLNWSFESFWKITEYQGDFKKVCFDFYVTKTKKRLDKFFSDTGLKTVPSIINGENIPSVQDLLNKIDLEWLCNALPHRFHGDFILENIVYTDDNKIKFIDWRQDFGGVVECGDIYYDFAKLNHNLIFNHDIIYKNLFSVVEKNPGVFECDILRSNLLCEYQETLFDMIEKKGYDIQKVKILTPLIWLNMSPLHTYPINIFLYHFGKYTLNKALTGL